MIQVSLPLSRQKYSVQTVSKWYGVYVVYLTVLLVELPVSVSRQRGQAYPHVLSRPFSSAIRFRIVEMAGVCRHIRGTKEEPLAPSTNNLKPDWYPSGALPPVDSLPDFRGRSGRPANRFQRRDSANG